jgi:hypothetical protein
MPITQTLHRFAHLFFHQELQPQRISMLRAPLFAAQSAAHGLQSTHSVGASIRLQQNISTDSLTFSLY